MNRNEPVIDFPGGVFFVGLEEKNKKKKKIDYLAAIAYAREAQAKGREVTFEEMQQFVHYC